MPPPRVTGYTHPLRLAVGDASHTLGWHSSEMSSVIDQRGSYGNDPHQIPCRERRVPPARSSSLSYPRSWRPPISCLGRTSAPPPPFPPRTSANVQAEEKRVKAVMSLGDFYVLNLLRPAQGSPPLGVPSTNTASTCSEEGSLWADPVVGRREGAIGPVVDVALVVVSSIDRVLFNDNEGGGAASGGFGATGQCGLEARVKIRIDSVRTVFSIPFVENLTRHVLAGPLLSPWVQSTDSHQQAGSIHSYNYSPAPPSPPPAHTVSSSDDGQQVVSDDGEAWEMAPPYDVDPIEGDGSSPWESVKSVATRWEGAGDAPQGSLEQGERWKHFIYIKVCSSTVRIP